MWKDCFINIEKHEIKIINLFLFLKQFMGPLNA